ncbi:MAG: LysE family translocator [Thermodesulfobacteriota bacterium]
MLGIENLALFVAAGLALNFTPGPDMLYVATRSASQGRTAGLVSALAISTGGLVHTAAAALGLSALLSCSALAFSLVKWAGAGYLVYLGIRTIISAREVRAGQNPVAQPLRRVYAQGLVVSVLNPKVALFFLAFLPQFADPASGRFAWQIICLGLIFCTTGTMVNSLAALGADAAGRLIKERRGSRTRAWLSGGVYLALGLGLAAVEVE